MRKVIITYDVRTHNKKGEVIISDNGYTNKKKAMQNIAKMLTKISPLGHSMSLHKNTI